MSRSFEDIARAQGWNDIRCAELLREYIEYQQNEDALSDFAERAASEENADRGADMDFLRQFIEARATDRNERGLALSALRRLAGIPFTPEEATNGTTSEMDREH